MAVGAGQPLGSVTGTVPLPQRPAGRIAVEKYTGSISGRVVKPPPPRAGVWLEGPGTAAGKTKTTVSMPQEGYQFAESMLIISPGTTVEFPNRDNDYHHVFSLSSAKSFEIGRYKKDEKPVPSITFDKVGFVNLSCEIHDHMKASILVVDSRLKTLAEPDGRFTITGVPPGSYTLCAQIDKKNLWSAKVEVSAGKATTAVLNQASKP